MQNKAWCDSIDFIPFKGEVTKIPSNSLRIVSWNTLADQYIHYQQSSRPHTDWKAFDKNNRHPLLGKVFQRFVDLNVDFVCLQEVDFKIARQTLVDRNAYTRLLTPTGHGRGDTRVDACCIFFKSEDWKHVKKELIVDFDDLSDGPSAFQRSFRRGNVGIIAAFQHRSNGKKVIVCNTHLYWDHEYEYVKLCQIHYLCLKAEEFQRETKALHLAPILLCGDLNSQPGGLVHTYLSYGEIKNPREAIKGGKELSGALAGTWLMEDSLECPLRHMLLESAYALRDKKDIVSSRESIAFTNATADFNGVIDYIFIPSVLLKQTKMLSLPPMRQDIPILPNLEWPSDHLVIGAEISFDD